MGVNVCIVHQLEKKNFLKVIPTISFLCAFIIVAVVWTLLFFNIENFFLNYIVIIVIVLGVNGPSSENWHIVSVLIHTYGILDSAQSWHNTESKNLYFYSAVSLVEPT